MKYKNETIIIIIIFIITKDDDHHYYIAALNFLTFVFSLLFQNKNFKTTHTHTRTYRNIYILTSIYCFILNIMRAEGDAVIFSLVLTIIHTEMCVCQFGRSENNMKRH